MIRIDIQKVRLELIAPSDIAGDNLVVEPEFFEQNRDFLAVWRRPKVDIEHPCSFLVEGSCGLSGSRQSGRREPLARQMSPHAEHREKAEWSRLACLCILG